MKEDLINFILVLINEAICIPQISFTRIKKISFIICFSGSMGFCVIVGIDILVDS